MLPLLKRFQYHKGSLMQCTIMTELTNTPQMCYQLAHGAPKLWYGHPLHVWTATKSPRISVIHRVAYVKYTRDFGRMLINDTVYVIVPLST